MKSNILPMRKCQPTRVTRTLFTTHYPFALWTGEDWKRHHKEYLGKMRKRHGVSEFNRLFNASEHQVSAKIYQFPKRTQCTVQQQSMVSVSGSEPAASKVYDDAGDEYSLAEREGN